MVEWRFVGETGLVRMHRVSNKAGQILALQKLMHRVAGVQTLAPRGRGVRLPQCPRVMFPGRITDARTSERMLDIVGFERLLILDLEMEIRRGDELRWDISLEGLITFVMRRLMSGAEARALEST
eukprot:4973018-Heterocapsa_arctica.AAC.1